MSAKRRILALVVACALVLAGCGGQKEEAFDPQAATALFEQVSAEDGYGEPAYAYLEFIQEHLSHRRAGSDREKDTARFLVMALEAMGYSREQIQLQHFAFDQDPSLPVETEPLTDQLLDYGETEKSQNILLTVPGKSDRVIVVGAHYDSMDTHGADDNGSGISLLLESALGWAGKECPYTIRYLFFGAEEVGMEGSQYYVKSLSQEEQDKILCMVNVDTVLAGDYRYVLGGVTQYDGTTAQTEFLQRVYHLAQERDLDVHLNETGSKFPQYTGTQKSDHYAFAALGIPYVYFWADNLEAADAQETKKLGQILHTENDDLQVIVDTFGSRARETLGIYAQLLEGVLSQTQF